MPLLLRFAVFNVAFLGLLFSERLVAAAELVLAAEGKSAYQIVLPDSLPTASLDESLRQTARLMQAAFQANGFAVDVVTEAKREVLRPGIFLGDTVLARANGVDPSKLNGWGYVQKVVGRDVIIAGRDQPSPAKSIQERRPTWDRIGTAKGVVDFLRQFVGTRFLYPDLGPYSPIGAAAKIDILSSPAFEFLKTPTIAIPADLRVTKTPLIEFHTSHPARGSFYDIANNRFPLVDTIFGGHTYERAIPREKYADSHPEYFALIGGQRMAKGNENAQYCISNPEVQDLFYQDLISTIDRGFDAVDLGQPDGFRACQCENCAKLFDTGNDWAEKLWILHRKLAERVEQTRPGKRVTMMSYIQTENPPKSFKAFPSNTRILLTGTNDEDIAPWRGHDVPAGFSSYIYNWCPNLGTRYTPMRTPRFVESQVRRLTRNKFQSIYRDGTGDLFGLEGPVYYTMGRMFDDPETLSAKLLVQEFCGGAFGKSAPSMVSFYDQLYHGIELYSEYLGTRSPAWTYQNIYGQQRKFLTDPFQFLGFLYTPNLLTSLETQLAQAEKSADTDKVRARLSLVRREFDYLKALAKVVHLHHAFQIQPDLASRDRLLDAIDARNVLVDSFFDAKGASPKPTPAWSFVMFPPLGHDAKHLRLVYDGYQEPYSKTPLNRDTKAMRLAPLPGTAQSDANATLSRMQALRQDRKWKELIEQFGTEDFSTWPADISDKASEAFHLRGQIHSFLKEGPKAEADLKAALKLAPKNQAIWLMLADNYTNNLNDDEQALTAYRQAFAISGKGNGWQPLTATISIARLLTDQVKTDEALAVLKQYGDMEGMAPVWKIKMLRAYGHVYAAQGNEKESLAKFREALELESQSAAGR
ncbi:MAG: DUF4838 domain-containing protein [Planctomycetaceae bacterium]